MIEKGKEFDAGYGSKESCQQKQRQCLSLPSLLLKSCDCTLVLCPGTDLLLHGVYHTTIDAGGLNCRVRNGDGCDPSAIGTRTEY